MSTGHGLRLCFITLQSYQMILIVGMKAGITG